MSKSANPGELRTPVYFKRRTRELDEDGVPAFPEENIFGRDESGSDIPVMCKWVNAHGTEVFAAMELKLNQPATLTCRYHPAIQEDLIVYRGSDPKPFEIISIDNVGERGRWMEIQVQRRVESR